jgi:hypothetical protein
VFAQDAKKDVKKTTLTSTVVDDTLLSKGSHFTMSKKPTNVCCHSFGKLGHTLALCPKAKPPAQVHAMAADADNASIASVALGVIILTQNEACSSINPNLLLLDSQSTVNLFSNPHHVNYVHPVNHPINVPCNKGVMTTNTVADFGANKVYPKEDGITNFCHFIFLLKSTTIHTIAAIVVVFSRYMLLMGSLNSTELPRASTFRTSKKSLKRPIYLSPPPNHLMTTSTSILLVRILKASPKYKSTVLTKLVASC